MNHVSGQQIHLLEGNNCFNSSAEGWRPYSQISNASAYFIFEPFSLPYNSISLFLYLFAISAFLSLTIFSRYASLFPFSFGMSGSVLACHESASPNWDGMADTQFHFLSATSSIPMTILGSKG